MEVKGETFRWHDFYVENSKESTEKFLGLISNINVVIGYKSIHKN